MINLFLDKKNMVYFTDEKFCSACKKEFEEADTVIIMSDFLNNYSLTTCLCPNCFKQKNKRSIGRVQEVRVAYFVEKVSDACVPVPITNPQLQNFNGEDCFSASSRDSVKTKDKTKISEKARVEFEKKKEVEYNVDE